jgi:hypothetical protein
VFLTIKKIIINNLKIKKMKVLNFLGIILIVVSITFFFGLMITVCLYHYVGWSGLISSIVGFLLSFGISLALIVWPSNSRANYTHSIRIMP